VKPVAFQYALGTIESPADLQQVIQWTEFNRLEETRTDGQTERLEHAPAHLTQSFHFAAGTKVFQTKGVCCFQ
jgi:hypothetical protein